MKPENEVRKELESLSPFLSKQLPPKEGFTVPDGYFQGLSSEILAKTSPKFGEAAPISTPEQRSPWRILNMRYLAAAAVLSGILLAGVVWLNNDSFFKEEKMVAALNDQELGKLLDEQIEDFDVSALLESNILSKADVEFQQAENLSPEQIDEYLDAVIIEDEQLDEQTLSSYF